MYRVCKVLQKPIKYQSNNTQKARENIYLLENNNNYYAFNVILSETENAMKIYKYFR